MKKFKNKTTKKSQKGITLIALIITIVVLLILAGVSINMLTGQNGVLSRVAEAKEKNSIAQLKEEAELVKTDLLIGEKTGQEKVTRSALAELIQEQMGGTLKGVKVTTADGKYDIYVKSDLNIIVEKHIEYTSNEEFEIQELADGTLAIIKYNGTNPILNIPREIEVNGEYKTVTQIGSEDGDNIIGWEEPFLEQVILPDTLKKIEDWALGCCFNEEAGAKIEVPDGVEFLGEAAFYGNGLVEITVPDTVCTVEESAFELNNLTQIDIPKNLKNIPDSYVSSNKITEVIIPDNVESIGLYAFYDNCIGNLYIPDSVTFIDIWAFSKNLLPEEQAFIYARNSGGGENKKVIIDYGGNETSIKIPDEVTEIARDAFSNCGEVISVDLNNVRKVGERAFCWIKNLTTVNAPEVTTLGKECFGGCYGLTTINIPKVTIIEASAFRGCRELKSIFIPDTITSIGTGAFGTNSSWNISEGHVDNYCTAEVTINKLKDAISGAPWGLTSPGKVIWSDGETLGASTN